MPAFVHDDAMDAALTALDAAIRIYLCSAQPVNYTEATSTYDLGYKDFGAGGCFSAPANRTPTGRKIASTAITDGTVTDTGLATHWGAVDGSKLWVAGPLGASQNVTSGNAFSMATFEVGMPDPS